MLLNGSGGENGYRNGEDDLDEYTHRQQQFSAIQSQLNSHYRNGIQNGYPTSSVSASATPVTYRKYHLGGGQQTNHHQQQSSHSSQLASTTVPGHRNAVNLDDFGIDYLSTTAVSTNGHNNESSELRDLSNQILNGFTNPNETTTTTVRNVPEDNDETSTAYIESYIEELSKKEGAGVVSENGEAISPTDIDLDEVEQNLMLCNLGEESEQIAEWRRELEQVLDTNNSNQNNSNNNKSTNIEKTNTTN